MKTLQLVPSFLSTPSTTLVSNFFPSNIMHETYHDLTPSVSPRIHIALAWISAFTDWDLSTMYSYLTDAPDFTYAYLPASAGISTKSRDEWHTYNLHMKMMLPDFRVEVKEIYESTGPVVAHIIGRATSRTGARFVQEYIMLIHIRYERPRASSSVSHISDSVSGHDSAYKLFKVEEFVDSRFAREFFPAERARWRQCKGKL